MTESIRNTFCRTYYLLHSKSTTTQRPNCSYNI